jgi:hypothetical protein
MADEDDRGRVERKARGPMGDGKPRNARELAAILERDRASLVKMYRANPRAWPDGIDPRGGVPWYGDGLSWTEERIKAALDGSAFDPKPEHRRAAIKVVVPGEAIVKAGPPKAADKDKTLTALEPWKAEGISRRTWYNRRKGK